MDQGQYKLKHFIRARNVQSFLWSDPTAYALLGDLGSTKVKSIQTEVWTKHHDDGTTSPYTVLIFSLDGVENAIETYENARAAMQENSLVQTMQSRQNEAGKVQLSCTEDPSVSSNETELRRLEGCKKTLEMKAHKTLQTTLEAHKAVLNAKIEKVQKKYETYLNKTLSVMSVATGKYTTIHATDKAAAKLLSENPRVTQEYRELCTRKLEEYQADLKAQYKNHIDDIELECRNWLKGHAGASVRADILDGLNATITRAKQFEGRIPEITKNVGDSVTMEMLIADNIEKKQGLQALADLNLEESGFAYTPEGVQPKSLFEDEDTPILPEQVEAQGQAETEMAGQDVSMVGGSPAQQVDPRQQGVHGNIGQPASMIGVPAAFLPMYNASAAPVKAAPAKASSNTAIPNITTASTSAPQRKPHKSRSQIQVPATQTINNTRSLLVNPSSKSPYTHNHSSGNTSAVKINLPFAAPGINAAKNIQHLIRKKTPDIGHPLTIEPVSASPFPNTPTPHIRHPTVQGHDLKPNNSLYGPTNGFIAVRTAEAVAEQIRFPVPSTQDSVVSFNGSYLSQPKTFKSNDQARNTPSAKFRDPNEYFDESLYDSPESPSMAATRDRSYGNRQDDLARGHGPCTPLNSGAKDIIADDTVVDMKEEDENGADGRTPHEDLHPDSVTVPQKSSRYSQPPRATPETRITMDISGPDENECEPEPEPYVKVRQALESARKNEWVEDIVNPVKGVLSQGQEATFRERFRGMKASEIMVVLRSEAKRKREVLSGDEGGEEERGAKRVWNGKMG